MGLMTKSYRKSKRAECAYGHGCCDHDGRPHKQVRRTARRVENAAWKKENGL